MKIVHRTHISKGASARSKHREYKDVRVIGRGSFGEAVLVRRLRGAQQLLVIKRIDVSKLDEASTKDALNEVNLLSSLEHTNIIAYHDSFLYRGRLNIVLDYADGGDLAKKISAQKNKYSAHGKKGRLFEEDKLLFWFVQILSALSFIHSKNILHRDLKTGNIFLTKYGIIKLGDFGIAKVLNSTNEFANTVVGTPYYLSPELCHGNAYNQKSDIWALGCVLYELATLKHAFNAANMCALVLVILRGKYPSLPTKYSGDFRSLVDSMLQQDANKRPSANEMISRHFLRSFIKNAESAEREKTHRNIINIGLKHRKDTTKTTRPTRGHQYGSPSVLRNAKANRDRGERFQRERVSQGKLRRDPGRYPTPERRPPPVPKVSNRHGADTRQPGMHIQWMSKVDNDTATNRYRQRQSKLLAKLKSQKKRMMMEKRTVDVTKNNLVVQGNGQSFKLLEHYVEEEVADIVYSSKNEEKNKSVQHQRPFSPYMTAVTDSPRAETVETLIEIDVQDQLNEAKDNEESQSTFAIGHTEVMNAFLVDQDIHYSDRETHYDVHETNYDRSPSRESPPPRQVGNRRKSHGDRMKDIEQFAKRMVGESKLRRNRQRYLDRKQLRQQREEEERYRRIEQRKKEKEFLMKNKRERERRREEEQARLRNHRNKVKNVKSRLNLNSVKAKFSRPQDKHQRRRSQQSQNDVQIFESEKKQHHQRKPTQEKSKAEPKPRPKRKKWKIPSSKKGNYDWDFQIVEKERRKSSEGKEDRAEIERGDSSSPSRRFSEPVVEIYTKDGVIVDGKVTDREEEKEDNVAAVYEDEMIGYTEELEESEAAMVNTDIRNESQDSVDHLLDQLTLCEDFDKLLGRVNQNQTDEDEGKSFDEDAKEMKKQGLLQRKVANRRLRGDCVGVLGQKRFNMIYSYLKEAYNDSDGGVHTASVYANFPDCNVNILGKIQLLLAEEEKIEIDENEIFI
eukprot:g1163.t1